MALAPIHTLLWPRFRRANRQRVYARQIVAEWNESIYHSYITNLVTLPLPIIHTETKHQRSLAQALAHHSRIVLQGEAGSGRSLIVQQLMVQWAQDAVSLPTTLPLYIQVTHHDTTPNNLLQTVIHQAGFDATPLVVERGLAAGHWLLLIDGLDELHGPIAETWFTWLDRLAQRYPALAVVLIQTPEQVVPTSFDVYHPVPCSELLVTQWIQQLLPQEEPSLICGPLFHDQRVKLLNTRMIDILLVILMYPSNGFPANRARLYATMTERVLRQHGYDITKGRMRLAELGYTSLTKQAYSVNEQDSQLLKLLKGLISVTEAGNIEFHQPIFQHFCAALHLAANPELLEEQKPQAHQSSVLPLTAGLMADPEPVYRAIDAMESSIEQVLLFARCLREHHIAVRAWSTTILQRMSSYAKERPGIASQIWKLFDDMPHVIQTTVAEQLGRGEQGEHWVLQFVRQLPFERALPSLLDIVIDSRLLRSTRRVAALEIVQQEHQVALDVLKPLLNAQLDPFGQLLGLWIIAKHSPEGRALMVQIMSKPAWTFPEPKNAIDARLLIDIAAGVLSTKEAPTAVHTRAALALQGCVSETNAPILLQACIAASPILRQTARQTLISSNRSLALRALGRLVLGDDVHWAAQYEALQDLIKLNYPGSSLLLGRVLRSSMALPGKIVAIKALLDLSEGLEQLERVLQDPQCTTSLKAAILYLLAQTTEDKNLLLNHTQGPAFSQAMAIRGLSTYRSDESLALLAGIVERERAHIPSLLHAIHALGTHGDETGIWALRTVLLGDLKTQLRQPWEKALDLLTLEDSPAMWPIQRLPEHLQWRVGLALAAGATAADLPGNLDELLAHEITALRSAAAQALGHIGGSAARDVLREALLMASSNDGYGPAPAVASELAQLEVSLGGDGLISSLQSHSAPLIRWVSAYALQQTPEKGEQLRQAWEHLDVDAETRSMMLTALGSDPRIVPLLETVIVDDHAPQHLRLDAIRALGQAHVAHAEGLLMAIITSSREHPDLAIEALNVLEAPLSQASLQAIRSLLRTPRPQINVLAAALDCLVRAGDCEAVSLFMRYAQHESSIVAIPAINGLVMCNDSTATALLSRLAHTSHKPTRTRLQALGGLLTLEGNEHLPAIRQMIEKGSIAMRLMALQFLLEHLQNPSDILPMLENQWPLPLRIQVARTLAQHADQAILDTFIQRLIDPFEGIELRLIALQTIREAEYHPALIYIEDLAQREDTPLMLRKQAIKALRPWRNELTTALLLSSLIEQNSLIYIRAWALEALLDDEGITIHERAA